MAKTTSLMGTNEAYPAGSAPRLCAVRSKDPYLHEGCTGSFHRTLHITGTSHNTIIRAVRLQKDKRHARIVQIKFRFESCFHRLLSRLDGRELPAIE
jgi:hypothetical protein